MTDDALVVALEASSIDAIGGAAGVGTVVEAGANATALAGARVLVGPIDPCGECEVCRRGGAPVCPTARRRTSLAASATVAARWVVPLEGALAALPAPGAAAIAGDVALAYTLYARSNLASRDPVVLVGRSPVTRFLVEILRAKGITPAVLADPADTAWVTWLAGKGALVARAAEPKEARGAIADVLATLGIGARPWRLVATTPDAAAQAAELAGPRATLTVLAPAPALPGSLATNEVTVVAVAGAHPDLVVEVAALCVKGELDVVAGTTTAGDDATRTRVATGIRLDGQPEPGLRS